MTIKEEPGRGKAACGGEPCQHDDPCNTECCLREQGGEDGTPGDHDDVADDAQQGEGDPDGGGRHEG
jgi:hypothetical protein